MNAPSPTKKLLIIGGRGFVGTHFFSAYKNEYDIILHDIDVDIRDADALSRYIASIQPEGVLHLAAISSVSESFNDPQQTYAVNFLGLLNVLQALKGNGFKGKFLYVGSSEVYGHVREEDLPLMEKAKLKPVNPYAVSKVAGEALCYQMSQTEEFDVIMTRPFNHIGPAQSDRFAISNFAKQIVEIKKQIRPAEIHVGDLQVTRDFTDVRDVIRAYHLILQKGKNAAIYNVCSGIERLLEEILQDMIRLAGISVQIIHDRSRVRPIVQKRYVGSSQKIKNDLGWVPEFSIEKTIGDIFVEWERQLGE